MHPYGRPYFGLKGDLEQLGGKALHDHLSAQLVPANLVVVVTGDFDTAALRSVAEREFGPVPAAEPPKQLDLAEPPPRGEKRVLLNDIGVSGLTIAFHKDAGASPTMTAWDVLLEVWKRRLQQRAVPQPNQISRVDTGQGPRPPSNGGTSPRHRGRAPEGVRQRALCAGGVERCRGGPGTEPPGRAGEAVTPRG